MRRPKVKITAANGPRVPTTFAEPEARSETLRARQRLPNAHEVEESPCCVCGGPVGRSGPFWGPWRQHSACQGFRGTAAGRLVAASKALGRAIDYDEAVLVPFDPRPYAEGHPSPVWTDEPLRERLPWRHIDRQALYTALDQIPALRAAHGLDPNTCTDGSCVWCGRSESLRWYGHGHTWADGSPAPLCAVCSPVYEAMGRPDPRDFDAQRAGIAGVALGLPTAVGEYVPPGLRAFAEVETEGTGEPFGHLDAEALDRYRWDRWTRFPGSAPAEHQAEARARQAEQRAARAAASVVVVPDPFGFAEVS